LSEAREAAEQAAPVEVAAEPEQANGDRDTALGPLTSPNGPNAAAGGNGEPDARFGAMLRRSDPEAVAPALNRLQQGAGNRVISRLIGTKAFEVAKIMQLPEPERLEELKKRVAAKDALATERIWSSFGPREVELARENRDLFVQSMEFAGSGILEHQPWKDLKKKFEGDVLAVATSNLEANRNFVQAEMEKTGAFGVDAKEGEQPTAEQQYAVRDTQKLLEELGKFKDAQQRFGEVVVGWDADVQDQPGGGMKTTWSPAAFSPAGPPMYGPNFTPPMKPSVEVDRSKMRDWGDVKKEYDPIAAAVASLEQRSPAAMILSQEGGRDGLKKPGEVAQMDLTAARKEIGAGLQTLMQRIEKAVPLVGTKLDYTDFVPIHGQLLGGGAAGASGINWSEPLEKSIVQRDLKDAQISKLLATLGLGALAAAAFIFAPFASVPMAAFLTTVGVGIGVGQAVASWDKYASLKAGQEASIDPKLALIEKEQVGSALFSAILDTAFAFLDAAGAVVGAIKGLRAGRALMAAAEAGAKEAAYEGLKTLSKESGPLVEKAVAELGAHEVAKRSNKSLSELADIVGKESETGQRLTKLAGLGEEGAKKAATDVAERLAGLAKLSKDEATKAVLEGMEHYGAAGVVKRGGGWKAVIGKVGDGPAGQALEKWRQSVFEDLQRFLAKETESQGVRTGTKKAGSDLDIQAVGGEAAANAEKAKQWLAGRLGVGASDQELKSMLDATVFVDPLRSHLADAVKDLAPEVRAQITKRSSEYEKQLIWAQRLQAAESHGKEAVERVMQEARDAGVTPWKGYKPLSVAEQAALAKDIDGLMAKLKAAGGKDTGIIEEISRKQAQINAANPEAYLGGGVRFWVTGRPGDIEEFAKAGIKIADEATVHQRIIAALSEGKFMDEAIATIRKGGATAEEIGAALKDLGKHGDRMAKVLTVPGSTASYELIEISARLELLAKAAKPGGNLRRAIESAAELEKVIQHANSLIGQLRSQSSAALKTLEAEAKMANVAASEMAKIQFWTRFDLKLQAAADAALRSLGALSEATKASIRAAEQAAANGEPGSGGQNQSIAPPPEPNQSVAPAP